MIRNMVKRTLGGALISISCVATATPPAVPKYTPVDNLQVGSNAAIYALTSWSGIYRKSGTEPWVNVLRDADLVSGGIYELQGGDLMLTRFLGDSIYRSSDDGKSWSRVGECASVTELNALDADTQQRVLVFTPGGNAYGLNGRELLLTVDGGKSWSRRTLPLEAETEGLQGQSIAANDKEIFVLADGRLHRSLDQGKTWLRVDQQADSPLVAKDSRSPLLRMGQGGYLFALREKDLRQTFYVSADGGKTWWTERLGLPVESGIVVRFYSGQPEAAYVLARDSNEWGTPFKSMYRYVPGKPLVEVGFRPDFIRSIVEGRHGELYLVDINKEYIYRSHDGGKSWLPVGRDGIFP